MQRLFALFVMLFIWFGNVPASLAENTILVPCKESTTFLERVKNSPDNYYFNEPNKAYAEYLLCGEDGLPHLPLSLNRAVDIAIPISLFLYVAGLIGWSGRAYLQAAKKSKSPEQMEIFIDIPLAILSLIKGLLWPIFALQQLLSGELAAKDSEIPTSPR